jgi:hypothetical protein
MIGESEERAKANQTQNAVTAPLRGDQPKQVLNGINEGAPVAGKRRLCRI